MAPMLEQIQAQFAAAGRTPKGRRMLTEIFRATYELVIREGLHHASLDAIAGRAGLSQAALRHYFPTRDELVSAFLVSASHWFRAQLAPLLADRRATPRDMLRRCVTWHLQYIESIDTAIWLESSAFWLRRGAARRVRDDFYRWVTSQYAGLIAAIRPALSPTECRRRAMLVLTLVLGAWITHGRGSADGGEANIANRRQLLIETAMDIATR